MVVGFGPTGDRPTILHAPRRSRRPPVPLSRIGPSGAFANDEIDPPPPGAARGNRRDVLPLSRRDSRTETPTAATDH
jgi:hypothetical protein